MVVQIYRKINGSLVPIESDMSAYVTSSALDTVAFSGSYDDLSNKPSIPDVTSVSITLENADGNTETTADIDLTSDFTLRVPGVENHTHTASDVSGLASVATSGSYNDLTNKPTIPAAVTDVVKKSTGNNVEADEFLFRDVDDEYLRIGGGSSRTKGANIKLYGKDEATHPGRVDFQAYDGTNYSTLKFEPTETRPTFYWLNSTSGSETLAYLSDLSGYVPTTRKVNNKALTSDITLTASDVGAASSSHSHAFSVITSKPTTISGYGITDAKIVNGIITLGSESITPITSHQSLAGYLPLSGGTLSGTLTFDNGSTIADYLPLAGGTMTGNIRSGQTDFIVDKTVQTGRMIVRAGSAFDNGASLYLYGKDHSSNAGEFYLYAHNGTTSQLLTGKPDGSLSWSGYGIRVGASGDTAFVNANGNGTGRLILGPSKPNWDVGGVIQLYDYNHASSPGQIHLTASLRSTTGGTGANYQLQIKPDGVITWTGTNITRSTNTDLLRLNGGNAADTGAHLNLYGPNHTNAGQFYLVAKNSGGTTKVLIGRPDGSLTWDSKNVEQVDSYSNGTDQGWIRFVNGLQIIWGQAGPLGTNAHTAVTLPKPFVNAGYKVMLTRQVSGTDASGYFAFVDNRKSTTTTMYVVCSNNSYAAYIAIGMWK